jgi:hypothetical protein
LGNWRNYVCLTLIAILPVSLPADDTGTAILHSTGSVLLNTNPAPPTSALLSDDLIETRKDAVARIESTGSFADIHPETMVQFEGNELVLDHGSLSVNTSRGVRVRVGCITITPVHTEWTHYDVTDVDGKVSVSALKDDVYLEARSSRVQEAKQQSAHLDRVIVREGEQKTRDERCGAASVREPAASTGRGAILNSPYVMGSAAGVIVGAACWALCRGDEPISPAHP